MCRAPGWCPLSAPPSSYTAAVERYLTGAGIAKSSARIYRISLTTWGWMLAGESAPTGPARRGAKPPVFPVTVIDDPALPKALAELAAARADEMDADTVNRELSIARKAIGWWQRQGWIGGDPTIGIERRPAPPSCCPASSPGAPAARCSSPTARPRPERRRSTCARRPAGRARLSYRRAEEIFEENTRLLANPLASLEDTEDLDGWTLHRALSRCWVGV
ncbi:hypothetical protein ACFRQM_46410 [Streptomyces sp. NPDC056831]|uniref:hypothetical protein n=1 Tax=Streptomyces sp. NPDC056831 TaxID=3345954 RepID=UPI003677D327